MDGGMRSGVPSGVFVKNRNASGCLIVRKKADGVGGGFGSSSPGGFMDPRKEKTRPSAARSDSESSDELLMPSRRRVGPETIRACSGLARYETGSGEDSGISRKRERLEIIRRDEDMFGTHGFEGRERKRGKSDVFGFDQYDGVDGDQINMRRRHFDCDGAEFGERRFMGSMHVGRVGFEGEYESGLGRHMSDQRRHLYHDWESGLHFGDSVDRSRLKMNREGAQIPLPMLREQYMGRPDEAIRVQGKNGVLKVMINKKKMVGGPPLNYARFKAVDSKQSLRAEDSSGRNILLHPSSYPEHIHVDRPGAFLRAEKNPFNSKKAMSSKESDEAVRNSENSDRSLKLGMKTVHAQKSTRKESYENVPKLKNTGPRKLMKRITSEDEQIPAQEKLLPVSTKEGKVKRGSGTEKQKLRERIRAMLLNAGWTIDYRPRRNRDYLDAVYINPSGTAYWSIIKAYEALQKQTNEDNEEVKPSADAGHSFPPISDEALRQLTRKTRKKLEKEMKKNRKDEGDSDSDSAKEAYNKHDMDGVDSDSQEERLSSFVKQGSNQLKTKINENGIGSSNSKSQIFSDELNDRRLNTPFGSDSHFLRGNKSRRHSRCVLLFRGPNNQSNPETDDFVPYTGKRTILSWLIDSGTVQLSEKVLYRRRKGVMLEGWITRDGIHCGCCSKILSVSKFEIHAGSKLRQPFQNIYLESGISLLQCQIDAWNRQVGSEKIRFHSVDANGDDPNDDTCGLCGDGENLICCNSCPSTFHLSCLGVEMLPPGDWHCPNCSCKFCGLAGVTVNQDDNVSVLRTCHLCEKKYHESCMTEIYSPPLDSNSSDPGFCGKDCKQLFEHLKKYLGTKHELDAGFSWSLIRRSDEDTDAAFRGISQRVESNSKLAVALNVMDECFRPIVDCRSGINVIRNVLYNSGSNFYRLSYSGFYTAVLERGDEIISAASIRFHGPKLAEMPFIGTRQMYRLQGMCRRLLSALELALCSLKVEKLIIPAIAELMHTWTASFVYTPLEESLKKEMRSMNMLVFPGVDMLEKRMRLQEKLERIGTTSGGKQIVGDNHLVRSDVVNKSDIDSSPCGRDSRGCDDDSSQPSNERTDEGAASDSSSQSDGFITNAASIISGSLNGSHEPENPVAADGTLHSEYGKMLVESAFDRQCMSHPRSGHVAVEKPKLVTGSPVKDNDLNFSHQHHDASLKDITSLVSNAINLSDEHEASVLLNETVSHEQKVAESESGCKTLSASSSKDDSCNELPNNEETENSLAVGSLPSSRDLSSDKIVKDVDEEPKVSGFTVRVDDETLVNVGSNLNVALSGDEIRMHDDAEATSSETHPKENMLHASPGDSERNDILK